MYELAVVVTVLLTIAAAADYVRRAWIRQTNPVPATWILMLVVMGLSFAMYWSSPQRSWTANIGVVAAFANVIVILTGVIATNIRHATLSVAFDRTQRRCLFFGALVAIFWTITREPLVAYVLVQGIALTAYFATVKRLWTATSTTEPMIFWIIMFLAGSCALYPAWIKQDVFAWIYLARGLPSTLFVIYLIWRIKSKQLNS